MVPDIGLMIGFYIITRMISFLTRKEQRAESIAVKVFAIITIAATVLLMLDLTMRGGPTPPPNID